MSKHTASSHPNNVLRHSLHWHVSQLPDVWKDALLTPQTRTVLDRLDVFLNKRQAQGATIFPQRPFWALELTPPEAVKVVILGQDPYHGPGQAQGLAFSVPNDCRMPPSLRNMRLELAREYPNRTLPPEHDLSAWARQGVLLLNAVLTVEQGRPAAHANQGWELVTNTLLAHVAAHSTPKVFMLWGAYAQRKESLLTTQSPDSVYTLKANHPSPLSARRPPRPFIGCGHFRAANDWLVQQGVSEIDWFARDSDVNGQGTPQAQLDV